jgi:hypothetical protein
MCCMSRLHVVDSISRGGPCISRGCLLLVCSDAEDDDEIYEDDPQQASNEVIAAPFVAHVPVSRN